MSVLHSKTVAAGFAYQPGSSRRYPAQLTKEVSGWVLRDADEQVLSNATPERQEQVASGPVKITLSDGWMFETDDPTAIAPTLAPRGDRILANLEVWHPRLIVVFLVGVAGIYALWRWGVALIVAVAIFFTPETLVVQIDQANLRFLDEYLEEETAHVTPAEQARVERVFRDLVAVAPPAPYGEYSVHVMDLEKLGPNALALPGGTMVVTRDLLRLTDDDDILAGILGHEIAHITEKHSLERLYYSVSTVLLVGLIAGDVGPVLEDMMLEGGVLLTLANSRGQESDADHQGIALAHQAGYDPAALAEFFVLMGAEDDDGPLPGWLSTHPGGAERMEAIQDGAAELNAR